MNLRNSILGLSATFIAVSAFFLKPTLTPNQDSLKLESLYGEEDEKEKKESIAGALAWSKLIKANQVTGTIDYQDVISARKAAQIKFEDAKRKPELLII
ncbi:MAG: hypothetical protein R2831_00485 [Chitinophagaceae bacterium]